MSVEATGTSPPGRNRVEVAVGVLIRPDGSFLLASRPEGKPYAGYWEFPGGKLEAGESVPRALARELHEELGIEIDDALPWVTIEHAYPHAQVRLHFTRVTRWRGEPHAREGQRFGWFSGRFDTDAPLPEPLLPATVPCLRWLALAPVMGIADPVVIAGGIDAFFARLDAALDRGLNFVQVRAPGLEGAQFDRFFEAVLVRAQAARARVTVNARHPVEYAHRAGGVHLRACDLQSLDARPALALVGASVHTRQEIERAGKLGLDYVVLGPVRATPTHPEAEPLGWEAFARIAAGTSLPVYAIGGLSADVLRTAQEAGAHGIALLRAAWA